jgi:LPXTG-motif cell wall-anchored protein
MLNTALSGTTMSLLMLAGVLLSAGGVFLLVRRPELRKQAWLMIVAALVMFGNVAIWSVPVAKAPDPRDEQTVNSSH